MRRVYIWAGIIVMIAAPLAYGHGVNYGIFQERAMAVHFNYAGGEPMSYVEAKVFGPQSTSDVEFQNGRTDARGVFAFVPDGSGAWRVEAWDGLGHKGSIEVTVVKDSTGLQAARQVDSMENGSTMIKVLLGLSAITNLALVIVIVRRQKRP